MTTMMQHAQCTAEIEYDAETESFYGRTVNVRPGGFDFWGSSVDELKREFAASAEAFEDVTRESGVQFQIVTPPTVLGRAARAMGRARSPAKATAARINGARGGRPRTRRAAE
jgi:predicted HicB family RNase H-like nuclease